MQSRVYAQSRADPEIRPQYLSAVLSGEESGYWVHEGEAPRSEHFDISWEGKRELADNGVFGSIDRDWAMGGSAERIRVGWNTFPKT